MDANFSLTMVIGGASSGKSSFAEGFVTSFEGPYVYLATAQGYDDEMRGKILKHQVDREGDGWKTVETMTDVIAAISTMPKDANILLDCATMWLNNLFMENQNVAAETMKLTKFLATETRRITIVTNEVGLGIVPENKLAREFRIAQGALNAAIAAQSARVYCVMAGIPFALKGDLP